MQDAKHFLEQADRCRRLAKCAENRETQVRLQAIGIEYMLRAFPD